jgi:hypothetical protein
MNLLVSVIFDKRNKSSFSKGKPLLAAFSIVTGHNRAKSNELALLNHYSVIKSSKNSNTILLLIPYIPQKLIYQLEKLTIIFKK